MKAYFDKEGLISFFKERNDSQYEKCLQVLKEGLKLCFTFSETDYSDDEELKIIRTLLQDGLEESDIPKFNSSPLSINTSSKYNKTLPERDELTALYFISNFQEDRVISKNLITASGHEIITQLSSLYYKGIGSIPKFYYNIFRPREFESWAHVEPFARKSTDIILVDTYINDNISLSSSNLIPLIKALTSPLKNTSIKTDTSINILLFSEPAKDANNKPRIALSGDQFSELERKLKEELREYNLKIHLTYIESSDLKEHARTIFTNYCYYASDQGFSNIIGNKGNIIATGRYFQVFSHIDPQALESSYKLLDDLQKVIYKATTTIKGERKSYFLDFDRNKKGKYLNEL